MLTDEMSVQEKCGKPTAYGHPPYWSFMCALPKGHEGDCEPGGNCWKHGEYVGLECPSWPNCDPKTPEDAEANRKWWQEIEAVQRKQREQEIAWKQEEIEMIKQFLHYRDPQHRSYAGSVEFEEEMLCQEVIFKRILATLESQLIALKQGMKE